MIRASPLVRATRLLAPARLRPAARALSDSMGGGGITYSGGHASTGQGGFYGSGGARANKENDITHRIEAVAQMEDVKVVQEVMAEIATLEEQLSTVDDPVSTRSIELKSAIKKRITAPSTVTALKRLVISGAPVWGLSVHERDLVEQAQQKMQSS